MHPFDRPAALTVGQGHALLLTGPAQFKLTAGKAECFGAVIKADNWIVVEELRQVPLLAIDRVEIQIKSGTRDSWKEVSESTIPAGWTEAAQILERQQGIVVVVGDVDSGKSSLCTFLANKCTQSGLRVGIVDADVGQADIGPPTTLSSSHVTEPLLSLHDARQEKTFFIGDTSPSSVPDKLVRWLVRLKEDLKGSNDIVFVNTDGWITDPSALSFKDHLLRETRPDLVLGLSRGDEIDPVLDLAPSASVRLSSSVYSKIRSKEERKRTREAGYRRSLLGSKTMALSRQDVELRLFDQPEQPVLQWHRHFEGFLAGLLNDAHELIAIGRIRDMTEHDAILETKVTEEPRFLEVGNLVLSSKYEEIGYGMLH